jgi:hypothetical protein
MPLNRTPGSPVREKVLTQRRIKAELILAAYHESGIDGVALSASDWGLGTQEVLELGERFDVPFLAANLVCDGKKPLPGARVLTAGGKRVGVIGITEGPVEGCEVTDVGAAVADALKGLGKVDVVLALAPFVRPDQYGPLDGVGIDLILDGRGRHSAGKPDRMGSSWMIGAGSRGKHVGVLDLVFREGASGWSPGDPAAALRDQLQRYEERLEQTRGRAKVEIKADRRASFQKQVEAYEGRVAKLEVEIEAAQRGGATHTISGREVALSRDVADHPATRALVDAALDRLGPEITSSAVSTAMARRLATPKSPFGGADLCMSCHPSQHAQWGATPHAQASQTLIREKRSQDLDCYGCHNTGVGAQGGPADPSEVGGLRDVQCEACHGAARAHALAPATTPPTHADPPASVCVTCHDGERDEGRFDHDSYRSKVVHR